MALLDVPHVHTGPAETLSCEKIREKIPAVKVVNSSFDWSTRTRRNPRSGVRNGAIGHHL